jgi:hypothetical protein
MIGFQEISKDTFLFTAGAPGTNTDWMPFDIPDYWNMMYIMGVGGGAGGGGGGVATSGTAYGGGAGSGGAVGKTLIQTSILPARILYLSPGVGGTGGTSAADGVAGGDTLISLFGPSTTAVDLFMAVNGGTKGENGGTVAAAVATSVTAPTVSGSPFWGLGQPDGVAGRRGNASASSCTVFDAVTIASCVSTAGTGGGNTTSTTLTSPGNLNTAGRVSAYTTPYTGTITGIDGPDGFHMGFYPDTVSSFSFGGRGGCAIIGNGTTGYKGGNGSLGAGGGGGGAAFGTGCTGGRGGDGGPGYILIIGIY